MNIENLKTNWKTVGLNNKNQQELILMTELNNHPAVKRIKIKLAIEAFWLLAFLLLFYDAFDGATKPLWVNILLVCAVSAYIITRVVTLLVLRQPIKGGDLSTSLKNFRTALKRMAVASLLTALCFGLSLILFFSTAVDFTHSKYILLLGMVLTLLLLVYISYKLWQKKISKIVKVINELNTEVD